MLHLSNDPAVREQSIFISKEDGKGFLVREGVQFHLYISTAPCGDARIFAPHEREGVNAEKVEGSRVISV